jgi:hypothetical protein
MFQLKTENGFNPRGRLRCYYLLLPFKSYAKLELFNLNIFRPSPTVPSLWEVLFPLYRLSGYSLQQAWVQDNSPLKVAFRKVFVDEKRDDFD